MRSGCSSDPAMVAVITGQHPFDVPGFHRLFRGMDGVDAYVQDLENFVHDWGQVRADYEALVFYNMHGENPPCDLAQAMIRGLGSASQGIVVLHHALLAFPGSPEWTRLSGIQDRSFGYHRGQRLSIRIADSEHPITTGLCDFEIEDETYTMADPGDECDILLTTEHPLSMRAIGWTHSYGDSRVFCLQSGHDALSWEQPQFREILRRGILWAAQRL